ncbi:YceI family protein [Nemorincola caseinilytica]|uniref:YceI family protein n=2 Tax=Nemorincola caseinilytica TaxID=2054315 RepID=A0ABP8N539_9BACT
MAFRTPAPSSAWSLDKAHSKLGFSISHLTVSDVEGSFKKVDAKITCTGDDFTDAVVELTADVSSINTDNDGRDKHLQNADYFDAEKYPTITFKSKTFKKLKDNTYAVTGNLTMHGVTKPVELRAVARSGTNPMSKKAITGFKITGVINRIDFGIAPSTPNAMLGEEVTLTANTEFSKD